jgi:hypothetical protein
LPDALYRRLLPHTFGVPLTPHVYPFGHWPQSTEPPHPSAMKPQFAPTAAHVWGVHALTHAPFEHDWLPEQIPQFDVRPPQPLAT